MAMECDNGPTSSRKTIATSWGCALTPHPFKSMRLTGVRSQKQVHNTPAFLAPHRERARDNATLPGKHADGPITSTKGIGRLCQDVLLPPHLTLIGPMGACSDSGQIYGYDIAPTLARCQERARRSIPLPSKQVNGSDSSYKAAGAPWEDALQPITPPFEAHKRVIQQSDMAQNWMFCGAKNHYSPHTTP